MGEPRPRPANNIRDKMVNNLDGYFPQQTPIKLACQCLLDSTAFGGTLVFMAFLAIAIRNAFHDQVGYVNIFLLGASVYAFIFAALVFAGHVFHATRNEFFSFKPTQPTTLNLPAARNHFIDCEDVKIKKGNLKGPSCIVVLDEAQGRSPAASKDDLKTEKSLDTKGHHKRATRSRQNDLVKDVRSKSTRRPKLVIYPDDSVLPRNSTPTPQLNPNSQNCHPQGPRTSGHQKPQHFWSPL